MPEIRALSSPVAVPALLRWCMHLLVAALLLLIALRAVADKGSPVVGILLTTMAVGIIYATQAKLPAIKSSSSAAAMWLGALLISWLGLLFLTPDAIYLAFPWFFLTLHLLPRRAGLAVLAATAIAAIGGFAWHQTRFTAAMAIGPILGAGVAVVTVWGYQALHAESEQRRQLIEQLHHTRAELAAAERESGMLGERERLAREIHDTLAQGLSSIQLLLRAAGRTLPPESARAAELIEQARAAAQDNLIEARRFVAALAPPALQQSSLVAALQRLCETTSQHMGFPVVFRLEGAMIALPTPVEVALLRIAQTALGNTTQHACATRAAITLTVMDTVVSLDIVDDGMGFDVVDPATLPGPNGGFGLTSMRSRATELGGVMTIESEPGQGTAIAVTIDLARTPSKQDR
ncbi:sensor histidine kinase [Nakamurella antarctica]|uniref:Sensor histidine kinase n=1 Tax=Nakamurella antarctica TaxID=1902245 RepID=A0A3G8ZWH6_9ACTN|nr:sensor histidine kinase [Nakamurella antarctica]AZI58784.1 sensor histidine kinase [Nakamurella antarctica]